MAASPAQVRLEQRHHVGLFDDRLDGPTLIVEEALDVRILLRRCQLSDEPRPPGRRYSRRRAPTGVQVVLLLGVAARLGHSP
jgi:hypothetical protein